MKAGERLLQTFECNVNYPVDWNGSVVAPRGKVEIIKILARTDTAVLSKSKTCIYKANKCTFSCRRTTHLGVKAAKCGSAHFLSARCLTWDLLDLSSLLKICEAPGFFQPWVDRSNYYRIISITWMFLGVHTLCFGYLMAGTAQRFFLIMNEKLMSTLSAVWVVFSELNLWWISGIIKIIPVLL